MEPTMGFEPMTPALRVRCSGQLSYVGIFACHAEGGVALPSPEPERRRLRLRPDLG
jgi:hypothetical protein